MHHARMQNQGPIFLNGSLGAWKNKANIYLIFGLKNKEPWLVLNFMFQKLGKVSTLVHQVVLQNRVPLFPTLCFRTRRKKIWRPPSWSVASRALIPIRVCKMLSSNSALRALIPNISVPCFEKLSRHAFKFGMRNPNFIILNLE